MSGRSTRSPRAFAVAPGTAQLPPDVECVGRLDRFDLAVPLASRLGVDVLIVSERLVDEVDGWDALRTLKHTAHPAPDIWVLADAGRKTGAHWPAIASRIIDSSDDTDLRRAGNGGATSGDGGTMSGDGGVMSGDGPPGEFVVVLGSKGGVGKTFVSANVAASISHNAATGAIDLDFAAGDLSLRLGVTPQLDVMQIADLSADRAARRASKVPNLGLLVWAAPARPELAAAASEESIGRFLSVAHSQVRHLVVDTPGDPDCALIYVALERSTRVLLVTTTAPGAVRQARVMVDLLKRLNYPVKERLRLVLNRTRRKGPLAINDVCEVIGLTPAAVLPEAPQLVESETYLGRPVVVGAPRTRLSRGLTTLAGVQSPGTRRPKMRRVLALPWFHRTPDPAQVPRWS